MKRRGAYKGQKKGAPGGSTLATKLKFVAPTSRRKDVYFTMESTKNAAELQGTVQKLARHVSIAAGWKQGPMFGKAMTDLQDLVFNPPSRPMRHYYSKGGTVSTDRTTAGTKNVAVMDDLDYAIKTGEYSREISWYETQLKVWGDNDAKGYMLVLQHCPEELQAKLKNQEAWAVVNDAKSVVRLLVMIRDLQYNKSVRKRSIMATSKAVFDLFLCA